MVSEINKPMIGKGMTAEVYKWEEDKVLKLFYKDFSSNNIKQEADIGIKVKNSGVQSPTVYETINVGERKGIIYEYIDGKSMFKLIEEKPQNTKKYAKKMAQLHSEIHSCKDVELPIQKEILKRSIEKSKQLSKDKVEKILEYLSSLPNGDNICHGDFHPDNIIIAKDKDITIDWVNAYVGDCRGDVARTCIMMKSPSLPPDASTITILLSKFIKKVIYSAYIKEYLRITGMDYKEVDKWILSVAAARLSEKIPQEEKWLLNIIDKRLKKFNK